MKEILVEIVSKVRDYRYPNNTYEVFESYEEDEISGNCFCIDLILKNPALGKISECKVYYGPTYTEDDARKLFLSFIISQYMVNKAKHD